MIDNMEDNLLKTCLHEWHIAHGAQMEPFAGYDMPIRYTSIIDEHNAVRTAAGMFDVSHMGEISVSGPDAEKFVNHVFSNDVSGMPDGKILYGMLLNPQGGVVDDLLVYKEFSPNRYLLVVNAANIAKDFGWLLSEAGGFQVETRNESHKWGQIAIQGPSAVKAVTDILRLDAAASLPFYNYCEMKWNGRRLIVSRTGYTGEDGFELYSDEEVTADIWNTLYAAGVSPCGLGCRDTLRFEAGLPLYGHELAEDITPLEAGLGMFVRMDKPDFIGRSALMAQKAEGLSRRLVGIELDDRAVARAGYQVEADGRAAGIVTTGYHSITLDKSICIALLETPFSVQGTRVGIHIRKKVFPGTVCGKRFYQPRYRKQTSFPGCGK